MFCHETCILDNITEFQKSHKVIDVGSETVKTKVLRALSNVFEARHEIRLGVDAAAGG